jgi:hypothetical protein
MRRICQRTHCWWFLSALSVAVASVVLHYTTEDIFTGAPLLFAVLIIASLIIMGWYTEEWTARALGLGWILTGGSVLFGWVGLYQLDIVDSVDGWVVSIVRGSLWVGSVLFIIGVVQWIRDGRREGKAYQRGVTEGVRQEHEREIAARHE